MTNADVKRIVLPTLPLTVLSTVGVLLAINGLWLPAVAALAAAGGSFVWLQVWQRHRDADDAIDRAARHDAAAPETDRDHS